MVLRTGGARRLLGLVGIVAVVLTPSTPREELPSRAEGAAFARTLAPGDHSAVVRRPDVSEARSVWTDRSSLGGPAVLAATAALLALVFLRRRDPLEPPAAAPGRVLLRAPTRSPPVLLHSL
jgi:hypothetical protein